MSEAPARSKQQLRARAAAVEVFLEQFAVRLVLSIAIIASLIPAGWVADLDGLFLLIFATEVGLRIFTVVVDPHRVAPEDRLGAASEQGVDAPYYGVRRRWAALSGT